MGSRVTQLAGALGEALAAKHLEAAGFQILGRNLKLAGCEVDILARQGDALVVVEVKTRLSSAFGSPIEQITPAKAERLSRAARLAAIKWGFASVRVDVVGIRARGVSERRLIGVELVHVPNITG
ncbi:MAG: YraN family protein [Bacillota bacterium]|nr:YraN family protein [Bacillota bacterium]